MNDLATVCLTDPTLRATDLIYTKMAQQFNIENEKNKNNK